MCPSKNSIRTLVLKVSTVHGKGSLNSKLLRPNYEPSYLQYIFPGHPNSLNTHTWLSYGHRTPSAKFCTKIVSSLGALFFETAMLWSI